MTASTIPLAAHAIQLAVVPVFLLSGIGALLGVMANRLARVIDRARALEATWERLAESERGTVLSEVRNLDLRRRLASWSINFAACAALIVCTVIVALFLEEFFHADLKWLTGGLFVCAMLALICSLSTFLREVYFATHTMRIDAATLERRSISASSQHGLHR